MNQETTLTCNCGDVALQLIGKHILSTECYCDSCRQAGTYLQSLPSAPVLLEENGATRFVLYRKDRVRCLKGADDLSEYRITPDSKTRRVVATCCNTPMFLEFMQGHWLSLYGRRWLSVALPELEMRTMTSDLPDEVGFSDDVPSHKRQSLKFFMKLIGAWITMRFRTPEIKFVHGKI